MSRSQAFTDSEIVAIAAVAAAALGGVVIGLGRGQANAASNGPSSLASSASDRARRAAERARHAIEDVQPDLARRVPEASEAVREAARSLVAQSPVSDVHGTTSAARREIKSATERVDPSGVRSFVEQAVVTPVSRLARSISEQSEKAEGAPGKIGSFARKALDIAVEAVRSASETAQTEGRERVVPAVQSAAESSRSSLGQVAHDLEERVSEISMPDFSGAEESVSGTKTRAGEAAQRAAGRSKDVAGETLATAFWLGAASAVAYFLLLSPERREQVKDVICASFEQARLLALDLQGYEPEM